MFGTSVQQGSPVAARCCRDLASVFAHAASGFGRPAPSQKITIALFDVDDWLPWLAEAIALLGADEAARVQRRRFVADRNALALAYALHRLLLAHVLGGNPAQVPLRRDDRGCPRLLGDAAYTSLSHAEGLIALAVTASGPVGVDIEPSARAVVMAEIAHSVCHPSEAAELSALDEWARCTAMLALWVRKEALLKAAGIGLAVPMESFSAPSHHALRVPALFADPAQVRMLDAGAGCIAAVAGAPDAIVDCRWLRPLPGALAASVAGVDALP